VSRWSGLCLQVAPDPGDKDAGDSRGQNARTWWCGLGMTGVLPAARRARPGRRGRRLSCPPEQQGCRPGRPGRRTLAMGGEQQVHAAAPRRLLSVDLPPLAFGGHDNTSPPGQAGTGWHWPYRGWPGGRYPSRRPRPGSRSPRARPPEAGPRLTHAAAPGAPWPAGAGSPAPMPLSTFVTVRFLSNLTVTREPSAFFVCTSYAPSPASVSIR
jgi:hypothetical protein